jgi:hypothetical protein
MLKRDWPLLTALLAIAFALFLNVVLSSAEGPQQPQHHNEQAAADSRGPPEQPERISFWQRTVNDPINLFTGVLAILTVALVGASIWQGWLTRQSVDVARRALTDLERPYVFLADIALNLINREKPQFSVHMHNYGRTPANIAEAAFYCRILGHVPQAGEERPSGDRPPSLSEASDTEVIIGQGESWQSPWFLCEDSLSNRDTAWSDLKNSGRHFYCWGFVRYRDIFRKVHPTYFCRRYDGTINEWEIVGGMDRNYGE